METGKLDVLAIGDTTIDAFIRLKDARAHCSINNETCELCLRFADKVPYESVTVIPAVGNSANAAVSAARLGLQSGFLGWVGDDDNGKACIDAFAVERVDTSFITQEKGRPTNYHFVLWYEDERTILVKHENYAYHLPPIQNPPRFIYLSSLGENSLPYHEEISRYVEKNPGMRLAFQPGTFQIRMGYEKLKKVYQQTSLFFCNKEEAMRILSTQETDIKKLMHALQKLGPKTVFITDQRRGAFAMNGEHAWKVPMYPDPAPPLERTGAGDAFSSTIVAALALGKTVPEALAWGPANSMSVVQHIGAREGLLSRQELEGLLAQRPSDYVVTPL